MYSLAENTPANVAYTYNFDPTLMPLEEHKEKLGHPNGYFDDHDGFDDLLGVDFFDGFGILNHDYNQVIHDCTEIIAKCDGNVISSYVDPCNVKKISSCMDPCNVKKISSCMDPCNKKLSHNAHERSRRRKQNALYAQLQALLPIPNENRKLSIPKTVCRALKYIPQLLSDIEKLRRQRDKLLIIKRISETAMVASKLKASREHLHLHSHGGFMCFPPTVTVNSAATEYSEVLVTIYTCRAALLESSLLVLVEREGLEVMDCSTFVSPHTVCRFLRLKMVRTTVDMEIVQKKIVFLCENGAGIEFFKHRLTKV